VVGQSFQQILAFLKAGGKADSSVGEKENIMKRAPVSARWVVLLLLLSVSTAGAARIKDIASIKGVRPNQLIGYGLVIGLDGTGDGNKSVFTKQSIVTMLERMGMTIKANEIRVENVAAVMVTAELPPYVRVGNTIDVLVSSIGDASNLQGGTLLLTPLKAVNGVVHAVAQGPISTGGFQASGSGANVQKNFPTVGRVVNGAMIEKEIAADFISNGSFSLSLLEPDFTTASRIAQTINASFSDAIAVTPNPGTINVKIPQSYEQRVVELVMRVESLLVNPDNVAKVVINERTGTVVMGENVRIGIIAIAHGSLSVEIKESADVSQPLPFSEGRTVVTPDTAITVEEGNGRLSVLNTGVNIGEMVRALNALGVTPRDLISILQAIKAAGALSAKLEII
jgi:flagellar P-ring protein precursor FlgI